jgi:hypothetical protein
VYEELGELNMIEPAPPGPEETSGVIIFRHPTSSVSGYFGGGDIIELRV